MKKYEDFIEKAIGPYKIEIVKPWFWKRCVACDNKFAKEKMYRFSHMERVPYVRKENYFCFYCVSSEVDIKYIVMNIIKSEDYNSHGKRHRELEFNKLNCKTYEQDIRYKVTEEMRSKKNELYAEEGVCPFDGYITYNGVCSYCKNRQEAAQRKADEEARKNMTEILKAKRASRYCPNCKTPLFKDE
jgi:hypothetical protein